MLGQYPDRPYEGEPLNVIISNTSSPDVLKPEGFLIWATALGFGVSCLGQGDSQTIMYANLGNGNRNVKQGSESGLNGVLRWNYGFPDVGTCKESIVGGSHFRWFTQRLHMDRSIFISVSLEQSLENLHNIERDGYNRGRDDVIERATNPDGIEWEGNKFRATVQWIDSGILMNATSNNISHAEMAAKGQPVVDGRVAVLYIQTIARSDGEPSNAAAHVMLPITALWGVLLGTMLILSM